MLSEMFSNEDLDLRMGGESSITPPSTRKGEEKGETGGEDMMILNASVTWRHWRDLRSIFEGGRLDSILTGELVPLKVYEQNFLVHPNGSGFGYGYAKYKLEAGGIVFAIQDKSGGEPGCFNVRILAGSLVCMFYKSHGLKKHIEAILSSIGGRLQELQVSRVDLCVDLPGLDITEFCDAFWEKRFVTRARFGSVYFRDWKKSGVQIGKGDILLRIYEKALETKRKGLKWEYLCKHRYRDNPDKAVRVEIQLRRPVLKEMGINTYDDYEREKPGIAEYVLTNWVRLHKNDVDRENRNQDKGEEHPLWTKVREAFKAWTGTVGEIVTRVKRCKAKAKALIKQAIGCLSAAQFEDTGSLNTDTQGFLSDMFIAMSELLKYEGGDYWERTVDKAFNKGIKRNMQYQGHKAPQFHWYNEDLQYEFDWTNGNFCVMEA